MDAFALTYVIPQSIHVMTTKFGVSAVTVPPVWHDIRLRACMYECMYV